MANVPSSANAGQTIKYGTVQFGGSDALYQCDLPDEVALRVDPIADDTGRKVKWLRCTLDLATNFYANTEAALAANMAAVRPILESPGQTLLLNGLGLGIGAITDLNFGPMPGPLNITPLGELACRVHWSVVFCIAPCSLSYITGYEWTELTYSTSWQNDFEGMTQRVISGHVGIVRTAASIGTIRADVIRDRFQILVPEGFKRVNNTWQENEARNRIDFAVVDQQLSGDAYPPGVVAAQGAVRFATQAAGGGVFNEGMITASMSLRVAPDRPRGLAGARFFDYLKGKQLQIRAKLAPSDVLLPVQLAIENGKWDSARDTQCQVTWAVTACIDKMLNAAGIWEPFASPAGERPNYTQWRTSIEGLWGNRGISQTAPVASEDVVINVCSGVQAATIGQTTAKGFTEPSSGLLSFKCDNLGNGGWLQYEAIVRVLRKDEATTHKKAVSYALKTAAPKTDAMAMPGPEYTQSPSDNHTIETHGLPEVYVALYFKGLRVGKKPELPEVASIGGQPAVYQDTSIDERPRVAFRVLGCPVWFRRAVLIYRVNGYVAAYRPSPKENDCDGEVNQTGNW